MTPHRDIETSISPADAEKLHGITNKHGRLPSGELRFRLRKDDGTAYIRTEAHHSGWQESHFHSRVTETYIVQAGVVFFALMRKGRLVIERNEAGAIFSTQKDIIHTLYLEEGAVLHTVKHGDATGADRQTDERTKAFDRDVSLLTHRDLLRISLLNSQDRFVYTDEYRHFDVMIWQVPAWSSAIFALSAPVVLSMNENTLGLLERMTQINSHLLLAGVFFMLGVALSCFGWILFRFRLHQAPLRRRPRTGLASAQTMSQLLVNLEACVMLFLGFGSVGLGAFVSLVIAPLISVGLFVFEDISVRVRQSI